MHTTFQEGGMEGTLWGGEWDCSCGVGGAGGRAEDGLCSSTYELIVKLDQEVHHSNA